MLQRFLFAYVHQRDRGEDIPEDTELKRTSERIAQTIAEIAPAEYRLSIDAMSELDAVHAFIDRNLKLLGDGSLRDWLAKTPNRFGRLALIFHVIKWASSPSPMFEDQPPARISQTTAAMARRFVEEFAFPNARVAFNQADEFASHARWVAEHILVHGLESITKRKIQGNYPEFKKNTWKITPTMERLAAEGWLVNRGQNAWDVDPGVHDGRFAEITAFEKARRQAAREAIKSEGKARRSAEQ